MKSEAVLQIKNLTLGFGGSSDILAGKGDRDPQGLIENLNLDLPRGKITGLVGGNGVGKTTLFNIINGFVRPNAGTILFNGKDVSSPVVGLPPHRISRIGIGRLFQEARVFLNMSIIDNLLIVPRMKLRMRPVKLGPNTLKMSSDRREKAEYVLCEQLGLGDSIWQHRFENADTLSYGQQRLLGLARLLMGRYELLLLDEPTTGISPEMIERSVKVIRRMVLETGISVFLIEHNLRVIESLGDFCCFMADNKHRALGLPSEIFASESFKKAYSCL